MNEAPHQRPTPPAQPQHRDPNYPPSPQPGRGAPPQGQAPAPQGGPGFQAPQGGFQAPQGQDARAWDNTGGYPGQTPQAPIGNPAPGHPAQGGQMAGMPQGPAAQPQAPADAFAGPRPGGAGGEEFPDMTQFRRRAEAQAASAPVEIAGASAVPPTMPSGEPPISQFSASLDSGFIPPDPNETMAGPSLQPAAAAYSPPASAPPPAKFEAPAEKLEAPPPAKPPKRSSSKLLGDADAEDDYDAGFNPPGQRGTGHNKQYGMAPASTPGSPIPKMMGGIAILMALVKVPSLLPLLQAMADPRYPPQQIQQFQSMSLDLATTMIALIAVGLGLLMSKN